MGFLDALNVYEQHKYIDDRYILFIYLVIIIRYVICHMNDRKFLFVTRLLPGECVTIRGFYLFIRE